MRPHIHRDENRLLSRMDRVATHAQSKRYKRGKRVEYKNDRNESFYISEIPVKRFPVHTASDPSAPWERRRYLRRTHTHSHIYTPHSYGTGNSMLDKEGRGLLSLSPKVKIELVVSVFSKFPTV